MLVILEDDSTQYTGHRVAWVMVGVATGAVGSFFIPDLNMHGRVTSFLHLPPPPPKNNNNKQTNKQTIISLKE